MKKIGINKNNPFKSFEELDKKESIEINGGDDLTEAVSFGWGVIKEFWSRGVAASRNGSPGAGFRGVWL